MRTIIAGSRGITDYSVVQEAIRLCPWIPSVVISGAARGVDALGEEWARRAGVPVERYPADWSRFGKSAGFKRNLVMADNAEALIAVWDGQSTGTKHMIDIARHAGLKVHIHQQ